MIGRLPVSLQVDHREWKIRTDYRDILVIMQAFNDPELFMDEKYLVMLTILYEDFADMPQSSYREAAKQAVWFLDCGQVDDNKKPPRKVMDWEQDEAMIFPAINNAAHQEVRLLEYMHWWTFIGYFMEIQDGTFSLVLRIRQKKAKGKRLEKWEEEFYRNNKKLCDLKARYTEEEQEEIDYWNKLLG